MMARVKSWARVGGWCACAAWIVFGWIAATAVFLLLNELPVSP